LVRTAFFTAFEIVMGGGGAGQIEGGVKFFSNFKSFNLHYNSIIFFTEI
jgi:N-methylhydantoinase B/oxoprolinase/acetone carboxylase alpha subunit